MAMKTDLAEVGTGDVFKDRGFADAGERKLRNYKLSRFSSGRLLHFITQLDRDVVIVIYPKAANYASNRAAGLLSLLAVV